MVFGMARKYSDQDFDAQFDAFMKESLSSEDSINSARLARHLQPPKPRAGKPWWLDDEDLNDDKFGQGLSSSGTNFLKKKGEPKHSTPVTESEDGQNNGRSESKIDPIKKKAAEKQRARGLSVGGKVRGSKASSISKDSLDDISEKSEETDGHKTGTGNNSPRRTSNMKETMQGKPGNSLKPGSETLEEMKDKERFFQALENGEDSIDFGKLNRELSQTASGFGITPEAKTRQKATEKAEDLKNDPKKPSMLSNVALMDSLDSTQNTSTSPGRKGDNLGQQEGLQDTLKTLGTGLMGTNTSQEILALQEAYRGVHMSPTLKPDDTGSRLVQDDSGPMYGQLDESEPDHKYHQNGDGSALPSHHDESGPVGDASYPDIRQFDEPDSSGVDIGPSYSHPAGLDEPDSVLGKNQHQAVTKPTNVAKERTMEDIMREMRELQEKGEVIEQADIHTDRQRTTTGKNTGNSPKLKKQLKMKPSVSFQARENRRSRSPDKSSPTSKVRKPSKTNLSSVKGSGYGQRESSTDGKGKDAVRRSSPSRVISKPPSPKKTPPQTNTWSPANKDKGTGSSQAVMKLSESDGGVRKSQLMASVESFLQSLKQQFSGSEEDNQLLQQAADAISTNVYVNRSASLDREKVLLSELKERERQWILDQEEHRKTKAEVENHEKENNRKLEAVRLEYEEHIFKLKQENFVLSAKVSELENDGDLKGKLANGESVEGVSKEQMALLEKEVKEQEQLMAGYQTENKRLYEELKNVQKQNKQTEERLFRENQKLIRDQASLRSQLERKENELKNKGIITSLAVQQEIAAGNTATLSPDSNRITSLENELDNTKADLKESSLEVERLSKKLRWYAENQEILDKDVISLKGKDEEISRLKMRIEHLQSECGRKVEESKIRVRERAADGKKILDLERQVKEMEQILRRRHPNSLPTLMMAASAADMANQSNSKQPSVQALESRIQKLETELSNKDDECNKLLRGMEQKFNAIKLQYEERISELEKQVELGGLGLHKDGEHPHTNVHSLERELEAVRERYRKQIIDLTSEVNHLTEDLKKSSHEDASLRRDLKSSEDREKELSNKIKALQQELELRGKSNGKADGSSRKKNETTHVKQVDNSKTSGKKKSSTRLESSKSEEMSGERCLTPYAEPLDNEKVYQPQTFTGVHVSDLQEDNERLRGQVEQLQLELCQQRVDLRKSLAETEGFMRRSREEYEDQIEMLRTSHQKELERVLTDQAVLNSGSRLAQLQSKVDSQEVMINHLRAQLAQAQLSGEQVSVLKIRETALETQVKKLSEDLREAKRNHTPEMRHFEALQDKVGQMEKRHQQREMELQQLLRQSQQAANIELSQERDKWKQLLDNKNQEVRQFQMELDSILGVLQELKRQGVVLSTNSHPS